MTGNRTTKDKGANSLWANEASKRWAFWTGEFTAPGGPESPFPGIDVLFEEPDGVVGTRDAHCVRYRTRTPEPSALTPDCRFPLPNPVHVGVVGVITPLYARSSQISDKNVPFPSCPPKI